MTDLQAYMTDLGRRARAASAMIAKATTGQKNAALIAIAERIDSARETLLAANAQDMAAGREKGLDAALLDRLELTPARIDAMLEGLTGCCTRRSDWRYQRDEAAAKWYSGRANARAARCHWYHL